MGWRRAQRAGPSNCRPKRGRDRVLKRLYVLPLFIANVDITFYMKVLHVPCFIEIIIRM